MSSTVPSSSELDRWIQVAKKCEYLPENDLKVSSYTPISTLYSYVWQKLCDYVCDLLLEESNVQPVSTPITVCGDIHGQVKTIFPVSLFANISSLHYSFMTFRNCLRQEERFQTHPMYLW